MKSWIMVLALGWWLATAALAQNGIHFLPYDQPDSLVAVARQAQKPLLVYVTTKGCVPCRVLEYRVFSDSTLGAYVKAHAVAAKLDVTSKGIPSAVYQARQLTAQRLGIPAYPVMVLYDYQGREYYRWSRIDTTPAQIMEWIAKGAAK